MLDQVYDIIRSHPSLCHKFAAFITPEHAIRYNLFVESLHYERSHEFIVKLDQTVTNKCALKKLLQMIANASSAIAEEGAVKMTSKLDEIRVRLKTVTRNNQTLMHSFERLFDQRVAVDEPVYEIVSLVNAETPKPPIHPLNGRIVELVDLTEPFTLATSAVATNSSSSGTSIASSLSTNRARANRVVKSTSNSSANVNVVNSTEDGVGGGGGVGVVNGLVSGTMSMNKRESARNLAKKTS